MSESEIKDKGTPLVSVIVIFLNMRQFLREAIESVLNQDYPHFELILVDDGSTDGSSELAREYADRFPGAIFYLEHEAHKNRGMSASRNLGIRHARGSYISFCDADDVWMPGKLNEQLQVFRNHPELGMVCGAALYWHSWMGGKDEIVLSGHVQNVVVPPPSTCLAVYPLGEATAPCNDVLVRRDVMLKVGGFEEQFTGMYEDQAFLVKAYLASAVYFSNRVSLKYRQHPASCMANSNLNGQYDIIRRRFLEWFAEYVRTSPTPQSLGVELAIERALLAYRRPWLYFLIRLPRFLTKFPKWGARQIRQVLRAERLTCF